MWRHAATQGQVEQAGGRGRVLWSLYQNGGHKKDESGERALHHADRVAGDFPGPWTLRTAHDDVTPGV